MIFFMGEAVWSDSASRESQPKFLMIRDHYWFVFQVLVLKKKNKQNKEVNW